MELQIIALCAWAAGVTAAFVKGWRWLPLVVPGLGLLDIVAVPILRIDVAGLLLMAVLAIAILVADRADGDP